jgi:uncharacterized UPF0146 family protein
MTPEIKAEQLVNKYFNFIYLDLDYEQAKHCALVAVDEILNTIMSVYQPETKLFWIEVKKEIEAL